MAGDDSAKFCDYSGRGLAIPGAVFRPMEGAGAAAAGLALTEDAGAAGLSLALGWMIARTRAFC